MFHVELELAHLVVVQLARRPHLVQGDEPLHNLALALEILIDDFVDCLDDLNQERVQRVLFDKANFDGIEQGDEGLGRVDDEGGVCIVALLGCLV